MGQPNFKEVRVCDNVTVEEFDRIARGDEPVLLKNCDFGECMSKWNLEYLTDKLGDRDIKIHEFCNEDLRVSNQPAYKKCQFKYLSRRLRQLRSPDTLVDTLAASYAACASSGGSPMRNSLHFSTANRTNGFKDPTKIEGVFPALLADLKLPSFLPLGKDKKRYESSVLRIVSKDVEPLTDYDQSPFVLCQVAGLNRVILWSRDDKNLMITGDRSEHGIFADKNPPFGNTYPWMCFLYPGDCLYIPMLWFYSIKTFKGEYVDPIAGYGKMPKETDPMLDYSISFSIFWNNPVSAAARRMGLHQLRVMSNLGMTELIPGGFRFSFG